MNAASTLGLPEVAAIDENGIADFEVLARIARQDAGLVIPLEKAPMVFARVTKRLRALGISDRSAYCALVSGADGKEERRHLLSTLTTNVTSFFREAHHFDLLARDVMPDLVRRARSGGRVRLWSAGCSTGPEVYSIAMVVMEALPDASNLDVKILATDIDPVALEVAKSGTYSDKQMEPVSTERRRRFFEPLSGSDRDFPTFRANDSIAALITFRELNLLSQWPMKGQFDVIFCRNVVIYFDRETQAALWPRFQKVCVPDGFLFLGHSERLDDLSAGEFRSCGTTTYRRTPAN